MKTLAEIEKIVAQGRLDEARDELTVFLDNDPENEAGWILLGGIYRRKEMWGDAINAYNKAKMINPAGPAAAAVDTIYDILSFVNTDLMNP